VTCARVTIIPTLSTGLRGGRFLPADVDQINGEVERTWHRDAARRPVGKVEAWADFGSACMRRSPAWHHAPVSPRTSPGSTGRHQGPWTMHVGGDSRRFEEHSVSSSGPDLRREPDRLQPSASVARGHPQHNRRRTPSLGQSNLDIKTGEFHPDRRPANDYQLANMLGTATALQAVPALCSLLSAHHSAEGGATEFASTRCAYPALPEAMSSGRAIGSRLLLVTRDQSGRLSRRGAPTYPPCAIRWCARTRQWPRRSSSARMLHMRTCRSEDAARF